MYRTIEYKGHRLLLLSIPESAQDYKFFYIDRDTGSLYYKKGESSSKLDIPGDFRQYEVMSRVVTLGSGLVSYILEHCKEFDPHQTLVLMFSKQREDFYEMAVEKELAKVRKLPKSTESVKDQIYQLEKIANRFGLSESFKYLTKK